MRFFLSLLFGYFAVCAFAEEPTRAGLDWWAYQPLAKVTPPDAKAHPIDAFIEAKLRAKGLTLSRPADRPTLLRRLTYDLTGLPPTPAEIDAFVKDTASDAYAKVVDRLLASTAYGERWARHWLDVVRFTESQGFEYDRLRDHAWHYRDYVIRSLNADKPYADFVREQIAGDALPSASRDGVIATGMLVAGPFDQAGAGSVSTIIRGKVREDEMEEMLGTVGQTFLGTTVNCARCHDHKFDPFSAKEYYQLKAVFDGIRGGERELASPVEYRQQHESVAAIEKQISQAQSRLRELEANARQRVLIKQNPKKAPNDLVEPIARWTFDEDGKDSHGNLHTTLKGGAKIKNGRLVVDGNQAFAESIPLERNLSAKTLEAWVYLPTLKQGGGGVISVQKLGGSVFDAIVFGERQPQIWMAGSDGFVRTRDQKVAFETATPNEPIHMAITYAAAGNITIYRNGKIYGEKYSVPNPVAFAAKDSQVIFGLRHTNGGKPYLQGEIDEARLYDSALSAEQIAASYQAGVQRIARADLLATMNAEERRTHSALEGELTKLQRDLTHVPKSGIVYAAKAFPLTQSVIYKRGDFEKPGDPVTATAPELIKGLTFQLPANALETERRVKFAEWVTHRDNPLTWRVIVNRVWQYHFGDGLVRTPNDFGFNGDRPAQRELLDWLALNFRDNGGRLKALHKLIVTSAVYQQESTFNDKATALDADNRLLWRYSPRRLEAEAVRDAMLQVSGKLNTTSGGPSFRPFKIETFNSAFYILLDDDRPELNRRAVYRMNVNSAKDPLLDVLDCPDPAVKAPRRNTTTTPLQALAMMNNTFTDRMVRSFTERLKNEAGADLNAQITLAHRLAFGRLPTEPELARAKKAAETSGMKTICWALFNAGEFVYVK